MLADRHRGRSPPNQSGSATGRTRSYLGLTYTADELSLFYYFTTDVTVHAVVMRPRNEPGCAIWAAPMPLGAPDR